VRENPEFESFVRARSGSLLRTAVLLVGDYGHAEDLLQVALLRTARHWRTA
jgi:DNA-directed RNA polymerase specialized sigma24 family protein